ncbi:MAG: hypothetical protein EA397_05715 [Deltaproteobacteria bacterium]|nr:MAG: hypothetical protein EA397_05715 [Deltaproteobacteria bacterium]
MIPLLLALAFAAPQLPEDVQAQADQAYDLTDPGQILDVLEADLERWGRAIDSRNVALMRGRTPPSVVEAHELSLKVLRVRMELAERRLEVAARELSFDEGSRLDTARTSVERHLQQGVEARVVSDLHAITARIDRGQPVPAATAAAQSAVFVEDWRDRIEKPERLDRPTLALLGALQAHRPAEAARLAMSCSRRCVDPDVRAQADEIATRLQRRVRVEAPTDPLVDFEEQVPTPPKRTPYVLPDPDPSERGRERPDPSEESLARARAGLSLVLPFNAGRFEGAVVRRGLSGALDTGYAWSPGACVSVRVGADQWSAQGPRAPGELHHDPALRMVRGRAEVGWCPKVFGFQLGNLVYSFRPVIGFGAAFSRARTPGGVEALSGMGVHGRVEMPVSVGQVQFVPEIGLSPYGRSTTFFPGGQRAPYAFIDGLRIAFGVLVSW